MLQNLCGQEEWTISSKLFFSLKFSVRIRESVEVKSIYDSHLDGLEEESVAHASPIRPCLCGKKAPASMLSQFYIYCSILVFFLFSSLAVLLIFIFHPGYISCPECLKPEYSETLSNWDLHSVAFWTIRDGSRILANLDCLGLTLSTNVCKKSILSLFASSTSIESWTLSSILRRTLCLFFARAFCRWWTAG